MGGRARAAQRKLEQKQKMWSPDQDRSWMKWTRCSVCRMKFCVNNFDHRQIDRARYKFLGHWICPKCRHHEGEFFVKLMILTKRIALEEDRRDHQSPEKCKCDKHVIMRLMAKHEEVKL